MKPGFTTTALMMALLSLISPRTQAEISQQLRLTSSPSGAQVYLMRGRKEESLGTTPLTATIKFHSDISIQRIRFRKAAYEDLTLEVKASQKKVVARLKSKKMAAEAGSIKDPALAAIQKRIKPVIDGTLPKLLQAKGNFSYNLSGVVAARRFGGKTYVVVPLTLNASKTKFRQTGKERRQAMLKTAWEQFAPSLGSPLTGKLKRFRGVDGVVLDLSLDEKRITFNVASHIETSMELKCVGENVVRYTYDYCAYRVNGVCKSAMVNKMVYEPCARRVYATKREVKINPLAGVTRGKSLLRYMLPLTTTSSTPFRRANAIFKDKNGKVVLRQGNTAGL